MSATSAVQQAAAPAVSAWQALGPRRLGVMLLLSFASGLPLALTASTLQAWLTVESIDIRTIGWFSLVAWPYLLKFLWAPLVDRYVPPWFGRRRGWIIASQTVLIVLIALLGLQDPGSDLWLMALLAILLAACSATQDIAADAYRTDVLRAQERGLGAGLWTSGYRIAMLVSGPLALVIGGSMGFPAAYLLMAALMSLGLATAVLAPDPPQQVVEPRSLREAVIAPLLEFLRRPAALGVLAALILYKFGDAAAVALTTTFQIRALGFTVAEVGAISKTVGLGATLAGALLGGLLMVRMGLFRALLCFGALQALTNLGFAWLAGAGHTYVGLVLVVGLENLAGGMGTSAFLAWLMALCDARYSAFQFALLSAVASVGRVLVGPLAAAAVDAFGWVNFFLASFVVALPGLAAVLLLRVRLQALDAGAARAP